MLPFSQNGRHLSSCYSWPISYYSVRAPVFQYHDSAHQRMSIAMAPFLALRFSRCACLAPPCQTEFDNKLEKQKSFIGGPVAYRALPRPQFSSLQQAIFPIYFSLQSALPVVLALTYPGSSSGFGASPGGLEGFLAEKNRSSVFAPIATIFAVSLSNLFILGPTTTRIMKERKHQGL